MNVDTVIWDKLSRVVMTLLVIAALVWVAVLYFPLMHQNEAMRQQIIELDQQIEREEMVNRELRLEIDSLKSDPKTVERLAREQLGLARPDETVIRFDISQ
ncbi:MAG: septum formation initiator family protein [Verrucomicrobiota bacterium]|nr:septum formation initiator family protein [Verrucomicrobiota bacterium]